MYTYFKIRGWFEFQETRRFINPCSEKPLSLREKLLEKLEIKPLAYSQNDLSAKANNYPLEEINE
ncbi:hypothetical protein Glove_21g340 [Diversispora epigaea]|uniref:Uncharacterized protein n=1 Tax=Diversispora epigaea TaxID=1348612 RepID=A0A397JMZ3_9GLOM|nr:hypothetical protein Glove_21g340 [Diversispora epigaea]